MKKCSKCKRQKTLDSFAKNKAKKDGRDYNCLVCHRKYTRAHYKKNVRYYVRKSKKRKFELQEIVWSIKSQPCNDCGKIYNPWQMDFDHLDDKSFLISTDYHIVSLDRLFSEISKCDIVCSNCHRDRTYNRNVPVV